MPWWWFLQLTVKDENIIQQCNNNSLINHCQHNNILIYYFMNDMNMSWRIYHKASKNKQAMLLLWSINMLIVVIEAQMFGLGLHPLQHRQLFGFLIVPVYILEALIS